MVALTASLPERLDTLRGAIAAARAVRPEDPIPVILGGGLGMNVPRLQESFRDALSAEGITDVRVLEQDPVFGVLQLVAEQG